MSKLSTFWKRTYKNHNILNKNDIFNEHNKMKHNWILCYDSILPSKLMAIGEYLFNQQKNGLFCGIGTKAVVIGKNQNFWDQVIVNNIEQDNIEVIRRSTGGGAVVIDNCIMCGFDGNLNDDTFNKKILDQITIDTFDKFLIYKPQLVGKNDIKVLIDDIFYKIIGNAYKISQNKYKQHFAGLINTDFNLIKKYLQQNQMKNLSKGTKSNISNVKNMYDIRNDNYKNISVDDFIAQIFVEMTKQFQKYYLQDVQKLYVTDNLSNNIIYNKYFNDFHLVPTSTFMEIDEISNIQKHITNPNYVRNKIINNPTHKKCIRGYWGTIDLHLVVDKDTNIIINCDVYCDTVALTLQDNLKSLLNGSVYDKNILFHKLNEKHNYSEKEIITDVINKMF